MEVEGGNPMKYAYLPHRQDFGRQIAIRLYVREDDSTFVIDFDQDLKAYHVESQAALKQEVVVQ